MSKSVRWLDEPHNVRSLRHGAVVLLVLSLAAGFAVDLHPHFALEALPGFHAAIGFLSCAAIVAVAKVTGWLLRRPERHYGADDD